MDIIGIAGRKERTDDVSLRMDICNMLKNEEASSSRELKLTKKKNIYGQNPNEGHR